MIDRTSVVACRPDVLSANVGGEIVLLDTESGKYFGLDAVGSDIWKQLATPTKFDDLLAALKRDYEGDAAAIEKDVADLLERLAACGLVRVS